MIQANLIETERFFTNADRRWRIEVSRSFGADAVLLYGHLPQARGELETVMRQAFDARREAMTAWRLAGLPPEKWSSLRYGFEPCGGCCHGTEEAYG